MAKITFGGMWVDIESLEGKDKSYWIACLIFSIIAGMCFGVILGFTSESWLFEADVDRTNEVSDIYKENSWLLYLAIAAVISTFIAGYTYIKVLVNQDDLFKKYNEMSMIGGACGFVFIGVPIAVLSPFIGYSPNFFDFFLTFAVGSIINGYMFSKKYLN